MVKEKGFKLQFIIGLFLMPGALVLNHYLQMPDFLSGVIFGIGAGLIIHFILTWQKDRRL
jgi:hypothetical protein